MYTNDYAYEYPIFIKSPQWVFYPKSAVLRMFKAVYHHIIQILVPKK